MKKYILMLFIVLSGNVIAQQYHAVDAVRNPAKGASTSISSAYYNPAGTSRLSDGLHISISNLVVTNRKTITNSYPLLSGGDKEFTGRTFMPFLPSLQAVYKNDKWALSASVSLNGEGKAKFKKGLPMFETPISQIPVMLNEVITQLTVSGKLPFPSGAELSTKGYSMNQCISKANNILNLQIGGAYQINKTFSIYGGLRFNHVKDIYRGELANLKIGIMSKNLNSIGIPEYNGDLVNPEYVFHVLDNLLAENGFQLDIPLKMAKEGASLNIERSGWGVAPILGLHFSSGRYNVGVKYEFKTNIDVENKTKVDDLGLFRDGEKKSYDLPALFQLGASCQISEKLLANIDYRHFFHSSQYDGINQISLGLEYQIKEKLLLSIGYQITKYSTTVEHQGDLTYLLNYHTIGLGSTYQITPRVSANIGLSFDFFDKQFISELYNEHDQKRWIFAIGIDYSF